MPEIELFDQSRPTHHGLTGLPGRAKGYFPRRSGSCAALNKVLFLHAYDGENGSSVTSFSNIAMR